MASGIGTSINVIQLAIEVGTVIFAAGGLYVMINGHSKKIESLEKDMKDVRENWVTRATLKEELNSHEDRIVGKVLLAMGAERRFMPRE